MLPFGNEGLSYDQLLVDPRVRAHGTKVMHTVGSAVDRLNDLGSVVPMLQELATRHISYGVTKQHFSVICYNYLLFVIFIILSYLEGSKLEY